MNNEHDEYDDNDQIDLQALGLLLADRLVRRTQSHPLSTVAAAAGVGVVLGGGVPNALLRFGASLVLRAATAQVVASVAEAAVNSPVPSGEETPKS
jgi:hypothetical protein